jgi:cytochrome b561
MRSRTHSVAPNRRRWRIALQVTLGVAVVFVGILGTLDHSGIRRVVGSWINVPALFGALLFALVVARLQWCLESGPPVGAAEPRELTRHLSRIVYLLLYLLTGTRLVVNIVNYFLLSEPVCRSLQCTILQPTDDLGAIFAYALGVLIAIRVLIVGLFRSRRL